MLAARPQTIPPDSQSSLRLYFIVDQARRRALEAWVFHPLGLGRLQPVDPPLQCASAAQNHHLQHRATAKTPTAHAVTASIDPFNPVPVPVTSAHSPSFSPAITQTHIQSPPQYAAVPQTGPCSPRESSQPNTPPSGKELVP